MCIKLAEGTLKAVKPLRVNPDFKNEVMELADGETLKMCFQCGTCTSSCPIARFTDSYRPRRIIRMVQLGLREPVLSSDSLWLCAACFTCVDRCPQNVEVASVLRVLRNMAVKKGYIPEPYRVMASNVLSTGYAYKISGARLRRRESLGLPALPTANIKNLQKLAEVIKFSKLISLTERSKS